MSNVRLAVYGTLRKGSYNFDRMATAFGEENVKHVKTVKVDVGGKMVLANINNIYPGLLDYRDPELVTKYGNKEITFDVIEVSKPVFDTIDAMEKGSGYHQGKIEIEVENLITNILHNEYKRLSYDQRAINHGDWIKFEKEDKNATQFRSIVKDPFEEREI